jgi:mannose-6-phosphate isomerase-like protein (cupin superfamily)
MLDRSQPVAEIIDVMPSVIDLTSVIASFSEPWKPRTVAVVNDYDVRIAKVHGEFTPHRHLDTDELFLVITGSFTIRLESGDVTLGPGQLYVVPKGVQHQPFSADGAEVLLIEPTVTVNTGDTPSELTVAPIVL